MGRRRKAAAGPGGDGQRATRCTAWNSTASMRARSCIAMSAVLPALVGWAERDGGIGRRGAAARGRSPAIDVAATLGLCSRAPMRFFRPANAAGSARSPGWRCSPGSTRAQTRDALGIYYGQCAGTMQAHIEATPAAGDADGFRRPQRGDRGRTGAARHARPARADQRTVRLFRAVRRRPPTRRRSTRSGDAWRICEVSHKPFPSGRATHGGIDGLQRLIAAHGIAAARVARRTVPGPAADLPPGRAPAGIGHDRRLCAAMPALCRRGVPPARHGRARRFHAEAALRRPRHARPRPPARRDRRRQPRPERAGAGARRARPADGNTVAGDVADVLGSPARPLPAKAARAKFAACCRGLPDAGARLWELAVSLDSRRSIIWGF